MNKKLIIFPGQANNPFFINELPIIKRFFNDITVFSYAMNKSDIRNISAGKNIKIIPVKSGLFNAFRMSFINWVFSKEVRFEIKLILRDKRFIQKKIAYLIHYGLFFSSCSHRLKKEIYRSQKVQQQVVLYSFWLSRGAYAISKISKKKYSNISLKISRAHGYDVYEYRNQLHYLPFRKYINDNLDRISFISNNGLNYHEKTYGKICAKREINRLGTYATTLTKKVVKKNYVMVASCSSIIEVKRLDLIIEVLSRLSTPIKWIHLGGGKLESEITKLAKEKLFNVEFQFFGNIDNKDVLKIYIEKDVDYFINLSDSEGIPVSIMEALSIGIPIISRNVGGINEIVNNANGLLLDEKENINSFTKLVSNEVNLRLVDSQSYQKKSNSAKEFWNSGYNAEYNYCRFFESIH